jgi:uncharacterized membrane protein
LATDIAYWWTADMVWADFSDWLLTVGVVVGYVTVAVALIETFAINLPLRGRATWRYAIGNVVALILATFDMLVHTRDAWTSIVPCAMPSTKPSRCLSSRRMQPPRWWEN